MNAQERVMKAFRESDLDVAGWGDNVLRELAAVAIKGMTTGGDIDASNIREHLKDICLPLEPLVRYHLELWHYLSGKVDRARTPDGKEKAFLEYRIAKDTWGWLQIAKSKRDMMKDLEQLEKLEMALDEWADCQARAAEKSQ